MMKVFTVSSSWKNASCVLIAAFCLLLITSPRNFASSDDPANAAEAAALAWIAQIDAGQYEESYSAGCREFHDKVTQDKWVLVLKALRPPFGTLVSRKEVSHIYKENGVNGLNGECMVITYDTSFSKLDSALEVVTLKQEDGRWRGAGYVVGPKPAPDDAVSTPSQLPPQVQTDTSSSTNSSPQGQSR